MSAREAASTNGIILRQSVAGVISRVEGNMLSYLLRLLVVVVVVVVVELLAGAPLPAIFACICRVPGVRVIGASTTPRSRLNFSLIVH